ncbi:MAG: hypothetical protein J2P36_24690, partial [Ktedonobacteraceae bacterium]|nr:hypothetical protein [Ktedonobacteraceae bacterium]
QLSTHLEDLSAASADAPPPLSPGKEISSVEKETPATLFPEESLEEKEESKQASYSLPDVISVAPSPSSPKTPATSGSGKKGRSSRKEKLATLETFDLEQEVTVDAIMQYFDLWRGGPLAPSKRADSNYQKALMEGAIPLFQRPRANGRKGYSLQEIDRVTRFIKRIAPSEKPWLIGKDWWKGKSTEIWVVARNMDMILIEIEKLEKAHQQEMAKKSVSVPDQDKMVWFTRFDHDGDPESHWFLYEKGPESEAAKCEDSFVPAPSVQWNISLKYQSFKRGEIELPTDIPPDAPAMQLIAVA